MKLSMFLITLVAVIGSANAHQNFVRRFHKDRVANGVYTDGTKKSFNFEECIPVPLKYSSALIKAVTFTQSTTCYAYSKPDCSGSITPPVGFPFPAGLYAPNVADFAQLVGQGARCYRNELPGIAVPALPEI